MWGRLRNSIPRFRLKWVFVIVLSLILSGCGDFFEKKSTELETQKILDELEQVKSIPSVTNRLPEMYTGPAQRVEVKDGVKLFYFAKNNTAQKLADLVNQQLGYKVTTNNATNQIIVHCPDNTEADKVLEFLKLVDVPPIQVNIDCLVLERFADKTLDWETTILLENLLGEKITLGEDKFPLPAFPGAALRETKRADFGLDFGYWRNKDKTGHRFRAMIDLLISRGYLKVLMNPSLETVNGQKAKIISRENAPLEKIVFQPGQLQPFNLTDYQWVEDTLEVTPYVFADGSIGLATTVKIGSRSKPEGVVQVSIITERSVQLEENRIKPGDSLVVGGLRKSEKRAVIRGVPFLKDLPFVGVLFSSKDFEEKATEIIFILTPSISSGGQPYVEVAEDISDKFDVIKPEAGIQETLMDPLGADIYIETAEKRAKQAEFEKLKAELEKSQTIEQAEQAKKELLERIKQLEIEKAKAQTEAEKAKKQAEQIKQQIERLKKQTLQDQSKPEQPNKSTDTEQTSPVNKEASTD